MRHLLDQICLKMALTSRQNFSNSTLIIFAIAKSSLVFFALTIKKAIQNLSQFSQLDLPRTIILCGTVILSMAFRGPGPDKPKPTLAQKGLEYKMNCAQGFRQTDLDINNVRASLLTGGDFGWNGNEGSYIVPNLGPGEPEVSSLFAGAVWMGGLDPGGNLKIAAQQFGTAVGSSDYWPGPLTENGQTDATTCLNWDRFFSVTSAEIDLHLAQYNNAQDEGKPYNIDLIPDGVKEWPALGNDFFFDQFGFELPGAEQGTAPFWDENGDGRYTPQFGDYPIIAIRGCTTPQYADEMKFWIFNDAGNIHTESNGDALQMEIQAQSFAYATEDALNDMTFSRYKLINRAQESLNGTYFGIWIDADLGCSEDDYVGCDTIRDMMYVYNTDAVDGSSGSNCTGGVATYGDKIPYLGVDYFRGPLAPKVFGTNGELLDPEFGQLPDTLIELGMSSFVYFNRASPTTNPSQTDPKTATEYYNVLSGLFIDGSSMTVGGNGFGGTVETKFAFHGEPNDDDGWSMCTGNLPLEDRRTVQASGPFRLDPGQVNELIIGIPWVPDVEYPCPDMGRLFKADDLAQGLFDSCFEILNGPDAPDLSLAPVDQKIIAELTNDEFTSNNSQESYLELDFTIPPNVTREEDRFYIFEGYMVYQLLDENVTQKELDNPDKAKLAFQTDINNGVDDIFNWLTVSNPNAGPFDNPNVFNPVLQVAGGDEGIVTNFEITRDLFTNQPLLDQRTYYYMAIAYAYNEYLPFSLDSERGQETPFLEGRRNVKVYSVVAQDSENPVSTIDAINGQLDEIAVFPNVVSLSGNNNFVSIVNIPSASIVNIYSIDGKFIRQFDIDQSTTLEWDLKNNTGSPIASGMYLIHVEVKGAGIKTLKLINNGQ